LRRNIGRSSIDVAFPKAVENQAVMQLPSWHAKLAKASWKQHTQAEDGQDLVPIATGCSRGSEFVRARIGRGGSLTSHT
jgi:hypothetical protein